MMSKKAILGLAASAAACLLILTGCGGGGGTPPATGVVLTAQVINYQDKSRGVPGAVVTVATYSGTSDANGNVRIVMAENVVDPTFRITAPSGFSSQWASYQSQPVDPTAIPTPLPLYNGKDLGIIYLWDLNSGGPPPPPSF